MTTSPKIRQSNILIGNSKQYVDILEEELTIQNQLISRFCEIKPEGAMPEDLPDGAATARGSCSEIESFLFTTY